MSEKSEKSEKVSFFGELFEEFTAIDLSGYVKTLKHANNASYLPWSSAWTILMQRYPDSYETFKVKTLKNKSVMVHCELDISDGKRWATRTMFLPVMDGKNNAIIDPSARAISDTQQRCFVKCLAKFGLGLYLYEGNELPRLEKAPALITGDIDKEQTDTLTDLLKRTESDIDAFLRFFKVDALENLPAAKFKEAEALLNSKLKKQEKSQ